MLLLLRVFEPQWYIWGACYVAAPGNRSWQLFKQGTPLAQMSHHEQCQLCSSRVCKQPWCLEKFICFFKSSLLYIPGVFFLSFKWCENPNSYSRNSTCSQTNNLFPLLYCHHHAPVGLPKFQIAPFEPDNFSFIYSSRHLIGTLNLLLQKTDISIPPVVTGKGS